MIIYGENPEKNRSCPVTLLVIIYGPRTHWTRIALGPPHREPALTVQLNAGIFGPSLPFSCLPRPSSGPAAPLERLRAA
jgi:hypothetical protein